jgi:hypothetical protein
MARTAGAKRKRAKSEAATITLETTLFETESFRRSLIDLYERKILCDVAFEVGGELFSCHKLILAISNRYFEEVYKH